jgi:ribosomal protein S18 acetylase RimI-like enzyme
MVNLRDATLADATEITDLIHDLAESMNESSPITAEYVKTYMAFPGCNILLAVEHGKIAGLLSYSIRPNLYHNGDTALIEELIVKSAWRGQGVGGALLDALIARMKETGCVEVSVTTLPDNPGAIRFYRAHGLVDEAIYLEKHL